jgi:HAD superfamily hydrolase (TIGR01549 family)
MLAPLDLNVLRAVFFDLDDTLFDRQRAQLQALPLLAARFPESLGAVAAEQALAAFLEADDLVLREHEGGLPLAALRLRRFELLVELLELDRALAEPLSQVYAQEYPRLEAAVGGAREVVCALGVHYRIGIISNGPSDVQHAKLVGLGIGAWLDCVVLSGEVGVAKPDSRIFGLGLEALGVTAGQALHVGDSYGSDVAGALGAGLAACWLNPDDQPVAAGGRSPTFQIRDLRELPARLGL